jgi:formylglycine-generating enzyme required for sulfatase activity
VTGSGVYNAIGNVWEWVQGDVVDGVLNGASLPESGYVADIDRDGIAVRTESVPNSLYYSDYFWAEKTGEYGILRGGFYGSRSDAGLYSVQAKTAQSFASDAIGFRCVKDL